MFFYSYNFLTCVFNSLVHKSKTNNKCPTVCFGLVKKKMLNNTSMKSKIASSMLTQAYMQLFKIPAVFNSAVVRF